VARSHYGHDQIPPPSDDADVEAAVKEAVKAVADDHGHHDEAAIDPSGPEWQAHDKHVFIFSIAGKPIYSRWGDEDKLASLFGVMQALTSFVQEVSLIRCWSGLATTVTLDPHCAGHPRRAGIILTAGRGVPFTRSQDGDELEMIQAGEFRIVFQLRGPIMLVMAARTGESQTQMMMQLTYVYNQVRMLVAWHPTLVD
jgi:hypothetical protein